MDHEADPVATPRTVGPLVSARLIGLALVVAGCALARVTGPVDGYAIYYGNGTVLAFEGSEADCAHVRAKDLELRTPPLARRTGRSEGDARAALEAATTTCVPTHMASVPAASANLWIASLDAWPRVWFGAPTEKDCRAEALKPCQPVKLERR